jgi:hypothetical protein
MSNLDIFYIDQKAVEDQYINDVLDNFAKLLAQENLTIIYGRFRTASINLKTRIVRIPQWADINRPIKIRFRLHEVSHALFTPLQSLHDLWDEEVDGKYAYGGTRKEKRKFHGYLNVIEDQRIDRLSINKFSGLKRYYDQGNTELRALNFFKFKPYQLENIQRTFNGMNLIDRFTMLNFSFPVVPTWKNEQEREFYGRFKSITEFDMAWKLSVEVLNYVKYIETLDDSGALPSDLNLSGKHQQGWEDDYAYDEDDGYEDDDDDNEEIPPPDNTIQEGMKTRKRISSDVLDENYAQKDKDGATLDDNFRESECEILDTNDTKDTKQCYVKLGNTQGLTMVRPAKDFLSDIDTMFGNS